MDAPGSSVTARSLSLDRIAMRMESRFSRRPPFTRPVSGAGFQVPGSAHARVGVRERVDKLVALAKGKKAPLILSHDNPDPDSLASALALAQIFQDRCGLEAK